MNSQETNKSVFRRNLRLVALFIVASFAITALIQFVVIPIITATPKTESFEKASIAWEDKTFRVKANDAYGTAFALESKSEDGENYVYYVTAYHVIERDSSVIEIKTGKDYKSAQYVGGNEQYDLAFFKVKQSGVYYSYPSIASVSLAKEIMTIGNAYNQGLSVRDGIISKTCHNDNGKLALEVDCAISQGMSGCPVYDKSANLVGMGISINEDKTSYVIPASFIRKEYERITAEVVKPEIEYTVKTENGNMVLTLCDNEFIYDGYSVYFTGITVDEEELEDVKINSVNGKPVNTMIDFIEYVISYNNLTSYEYGASFKVNVNTSNGYKEIKIK